MPNRPSLNGTVMYGYDSKNQLISENKVSSGDPFSFNYIYDSAGNLTNGGASTYNIANQLTSGGAAHDASGNQVAIPDPSGPVAATFDQNDQMTSIGNPPAQTMGYYPDGRRMWKQPSGGSPTYYFYDDGPIPACEFNDSGAITQFHTSGVNGLLCSTAKSGSSWYPTYYAFDWRGNTVNLFDGSGTVYANTTYKAYNGRNADHTYYGAGYEGFGGQFGYCKDFVEGLYLPGAPLLLAAGRPLPQPRSDRPDGRPQRL